LVAVIGRSDYLGILKIYDILGGEVITLVDERWELGSQ